MPDPDDIVTRWNERDPARRRALLAALWSPAAYRDAMAQAEGRDGLPALIAGVQARFPCLRFGPFGRADGHAELVPFSWSLEPQRAEAPVAGTDVAALDGEARLRAVTGFLDRVLDGTC